MHVAVWRGGMEQVMNGRVRVWLGVGQGRECIVKCGASRWSGHEMRDVDAFVKRVCEGRTEGEGGCQGQCERFVRSATGK